MRKRHPILLELWRTRSCNVDDQIEALDRMERTPGAERNHADLIRARHGNFVEPSGRSNRSSRRCAR